MNNRENVAKCLDRLRKMAEIERFRGQFPSILIECETGCGEDYFCQKYLEIVSEYRVVGVIEKDCILKLRFPVNGTKYDYDRFFSSPGMIAKAKSLNRFNGVFYIDLSEVEERQLVNDENFLRLIQFIEKNNSNMKFVFHVTRVSGLVETLFPIMKSHIPVQQIRIDEPSLEESMDYLYSQLGWDEVCIDKDTSERLRCLVKKISQYSAYQYFATLSQLAENIKMEAYLEEFNLRQGISEEMIDAIQDRIIPIAEETERTVGFQI